jgi:hypothetical protein
MQAQRKRGKKPGAPKTGGRKKGSLNKATAIAGKARAEIIERAAKEGLTPLEVMLDNMKFAREAAAMLLTKLMANPETTVDQYKELMALRRVAQECARDAAPFVHPKLSSVDVKGDLGVTLKTHEQAVEEMERKAREVRAMRDASPAAVHASH